MRAKYVIKNSIWGIVSQLLGIILGFVGRTVFIRILNAEYLGISGLFSNILSILSLSELGFSSAIAFHLYGSVAEHNDEKIAGIMSFYKTVYRIIASVILLIGSALLPFLQYLIKDSSFDIGYIRVVYFLYLLNTVSSYLFSYRYTLATADQKGYILLKIDSIFRIITCIANIIVLIVFRNFILYLVIQMLIGVLGNYTKAIRLTKTYPVLRQKTKISRAEKNKIISDVKNIFAGKLSTVIVTSTDNILISAMINVATVGLYSNYSMIIGYVQSFLSQFTSATQASIGNMIASESKDYANEILNKLTIIIYFAVSFCSASLFVLLNPFIKVWLGDSYLLSIGVVFWCVISFYIQIIKAPLWYSLGGVGLFKQDRNISIVGAISNIIISIVCARFFGLSGIFMGTVFSQLIQWFLKCRLLFSEYLNRSSIEYVFLFLKLTVLTIVISGCTYALCNFIPNDNSYVHLVISALLCLLVPNIINVILFRNSDAYSYILKLISSFVKGKA